MTWVKVDDAAPEHPKFMLLGRDRIPALGVWLTALAYANRHHTDGLVPTAALPSGFARIASRLVEAGLFEPIDGGYRIHDYADYQPTRERAEEISAERSEAGRHGGLASGTARKAQREARGKQVA